MLQADLQVQLLQEEHRAARKLGQRRKTITSVSNGQAMVEVDKVEVKVALSSPWKTWVWRWESMVSTSSVESSIVEVTKPARRGGDDGHQIMHFRRWRASQAFTDNANDWDMKQVEACHIFVHYSTVQGSLNPKMIPKLRYMLMPMIFYLFLVCL